MITSEVDFNADGKQTGYLRLPHSVHRSAHGWIPIPVIVIKNGQGPTVLLTAGNHGDEYAGQIALSKLGRDLMPGHIRGGIIILTMANHPAARAGLRTSPNDQGNLNRSFPGDPVGNPTQVMAHYIEERLLPICDYAVDLHLGGSSLFYPPTLLRGVRHTAEDEAKLRALQHAFDLPFARIFTGGGGPNSTARTLMGAANRKGVLWVMAELGDGGSVSRDILGLTERGLRRVLGSLDMLPGFCPDTARGTREMNVVGSVYAYDMDPFAPLNDIAEEVEPGEIVGRIHTPDTPWHSATDVTAPFAGVGLCKRVPGQTDPADALCHISKDAA